MSRTCPRCKAENRGQARHCVSCGAPLTPSSGGVRYCPANRHPMDPGWDSCPYCASEAAAQARNAQPSPPPPLPAAPRAGGNRQATIVESPLPPGPPPPEPARHDAPDQSQSLRRKATQFAGPSEGAQLLAKSDTRRIVAILITYTWRSEGEIFPVREGRNRIGSDPGCDVHLAADPQMSSIHATIIYRGHDFWIDDEKSMNGTFVNDECIEEKQRLPSGARIQTGATVWRFIAVGSVP